MIELDRAWLRVNPLPQPGPDTDKNKRGRVLAAGGSETVPGALLLTGEAAFRAGAGKVQLATVERAASALGVRMPEAASHALPANADGELHGDAGEKLVAMLERCDALVLGPGMGPEADARGILRRLLDAPTDVALLLDASILAAARELAVPARSWPAPLVMTPHLGEMAGLMYDGEVTASAACAEAAAARFNATIVLKTSETWIASPGADTLHYSGGGAGLATGGSGDVLAGVIAGLLARGADPVTAAGWGVWLHGRAGSRLAELVGPLGFMATELLREIPGLMAMATD